MKKYDNFSYKVLTKWSLQEHKNKGQVQLDCVTVYKSFSSHSLNSASQCWPVTNMGGHKFSKYIKANEYLLEHIQFNSLFLHYTRHLHMLYTSKRKKISNK